MRKKKRKIEACTNVLLDDSAALLAVVQKQTAGRALAEREGAPETTQVSILCGACTEHEQTECSLILWRNSRCVEDQKSPASSTARFVN
jgi:hypothetical protein